MAKIMLHNHISTALKLAKDFTPHCGGQVRFNSKPWIRKYKQPTFEKKLFLAAMEPIKKLDRRPTWEKCNRPQYVAALTDRTVHPYDEIIAKEFREEALRARFIAVYQKNSMVAEDQRLAKNALFKQNLHLRMHSIDAFRVALQGTHLDALIPHFESGHTCAVVSEEPRVAELLKLDRKLHSFVLLFGVVDNRILRKDQLVEYSQMPSLDAMRAQLCYTLDSAARSVSSNLSHHLVALSANLDQYVKQNQAPSSEKDK